MTLSLLPYLLLIATLLAWLGTRKKLWPLLLGTSIAAAVWQGTMTPAALGGVTLLGLFAFGWRRYREAGPPLLRLAILSLLIVTSLALALHAIPGFTPLRLMDNLALSEHSPAFSIIYSYDKAVAGVLLITLCATPANGRDEWLRLLHQSLPIWLVTFVAASAVLMVAGYLRFDPKWSNAFLWWALGNLFFTCVAEEGFFRLLIHAPIQRLSRLHSANGGVAIGITALLFGLVHGTAGWPMALAATVAGVGYGWAFQRSGRVEAAIVVHFGVNAAHFLLLTYPLAR